MFDSNKQDQSALFIIAEESNTKCRCDLSKKNNLFENFSIVCKGSDFNRSFHLLQQYAILFATSFSDTQSIDDHILLSRDQHYPHHLDHR